MEGGNSRLKIHTSVVSARPSPETANAAPPQKEAAAKPRASSKRADRRSRPKLSLTTGEKLIRNTAIAGAAFLCVLAVRNVNQPWSDTAINGIRQAMTMRVDWDESIGRLSFVRALVPETALVFLNLGEKADLLPPVNGGLSHAYSQEQPWLEFDAESGAPVCAVAGGRVTAAAQGMGGDWIVLIEHDGGMETVYGYLASARVKAGQPVEAGDVIGFAADGDKARLYFELRENGQSVDPTGRFK